MIADDQHPRVKQVTGPYIYASESKGELGIISEANAAETLASAYTQGKFNFFDMLVPDTSKNDDSAAKQ